MAQHLGGSTGLHLDISMPAPAASKLIQPTSTLTVTQAVAVHSQTVLPQDVSDSNQRLLQARLETLEARFESLQFDTHMKVVQQSPVDVRLEKLERHIQMETARLDHLENTWSRLRLELLETRPKGNPKMETGVQPKTEMLGASDGFGDAAVTTCFRASTVSEERGDTEQRNDKEVFAEVERDTHMSTLQLASQATSHENTLPQSMHVADTDANLERGHSRQGMTEVFYSDGEYEWEPSVYDALVLMVLPGIGFGHILFLSFQFLIYLVMVGVTVGILGTDTFQSQPYSDIDSMLYWRYTDGHSETFVDPLSYTTLLSRICAADETVSLATQHAATFGDIDDYKNDYGGGLANVAVILWVLCCATEIRKALNFAYAMLELPRRKHVEFDRDDSGCIQFTGLSCFGRCVVSFIFAMRVATASALVVEGTTWLAYTTSITDLLLNASALGFVLDIDNFIYDATSLQSLASLHAALKPAPLLYRMSHALIPIGIILGVVGFMSYVNIVLLDGVVNKGMNQLREEICQPEQSQQLAFGRSPLDWMTYADLKSHSSQTDIFEFTAAKVIQGASDANGYAYKVESLSDLHQMAAATIGSFAAQDFLCEDLNTLPSASGSLGQRLYVATGNTELYSELRTCQDARPYCRENGTVGINVRFMCPVTCGCGLGRLPEDDMDSLPTIDLLWDKATSDYGCPEQGCTEYKNMFLDSWPCADSSLSFLLQNGWNETLMQLQSNDVISSSDVAVFMQKGCEPLATMGLLSDASIGAVLCGVVSSSANFHGMSTVCPVACSCNPNACPGICPPSCCRAAPGPTGGDGGPPDGAGAGDAFSTLMDMFVPIESF